jgi:hypothetical protein
VETQTFGNRAISIEGAQPAYYAPGGDVFFRLLTGCASLSVKRPMIRRLIRLTSQVWHLTHAPGHVEDRRRWIALRAEGAIAAAPCVVLANVVFAGEGMFKIPGTLMNRGALWAATLSVVHAGSHFSLAFHYGTKRSTNPNCQRTKVTNIFITKLECQPSSE